MSFTRSTGRRLLAMAAMAVAALPLGQVLAESTLVTMNTSKGDIVLELDQSRAPQTVQNFLQYVDDGFYDNTVFHRVIEGFMIQGGGFTEEYRRKSTRPPVSNEAYNGLRNEHYTIAMARTTAPHSATSQFFINSTDNRNLDHTGTTQRGWGYTVFGKVVDGHAIVDAISQVRTGAGGPFSRDVPVEPIVILSTTRHLVGDVAQPVVGAAGADFSTNSAESSKRLSTESAAVLDADGKEIIEQN